MFLSEFINMIERESKSGQEIFPVVQRDISWMSFNYRVLQEAKDKTVPLLERIKFLAIYSSNLDEFYRIRVAQHRNLIRISKRTKKELEYDPKQILKTISKIVNQQQIEFSNIFEQQIIPELKKHDIYLLRRLELNTDQKIFVEDYFKSKMLPFVHPVLLAKDKIRVFLNNAELYLSISLQPKHSFTAKTEYAIAKIPSDYLPRFIELPSKNGRHEIIMIDDVVRNSVSWLFPGYEILDTYSIKLTRDAELYIDDEFSGNLIQKVQQSLQKRNVGPASRFIYDRSMPENLLDFLVDNFQLEKLDLLPEGRYHNNSDFFKFPDFGITQLKNKPLKPLVYALLEKPTAENFFAALQQRDHLLHYPYQSYESVIRFFEVAANDPNVTNIKVVQYRVAKKSRIIQALLNAAKNGKQVSVFIEVKARFDEEANLKWGETLQNGGVSVFYSMPGIKVHSKLALVSRKEQGKEKLYAYFATGNFNEDTAKIYSDFGLFTTDPRLTKEMAHVFRYLETSNKDNIPPFKHLLVGQFNLRSSLISKIKREIAFAKAGKKAQIILKFNSLEDKQMIQLLYKASEAGVEIKLIVRGICCLVPGLKNISQNISAISIVDRFLEHGRVFIFRNDGDEEIYLSSADWMERNLSHRVETTFPIYDPALKKIIKDIIAIQFSDNVKARIINETQNNKFKTDKNSLAIRSQIETYYYFLREEK